MIREIVDSLAQFIVSTIFFAQVWALSSYLMIWLRCSTIVSMELSFVVAMIVLAKLQVTIRKRGL